MTKLFGSSRKRKEKYLIHMEAKPGVGRNRGWAMGRVDEDTTVGHRFDQDPLPTPTHTYRQWKRDLRLRQATTSLQKHRRGGCRR